MHVRSKTPPQAATQTQTSPYDLELPSRNVRLSGGYLEEPHPPGELLSYANEAIAWLRITLASEPASQSAINVLAAVLTELGSSASILSDEVFELERALIQSDTSGRAWAAAFGSEREAFLRAAEEWEAERAEREAEVAEVWDELKQEVGEVWEGVRVARQQEQREAAASVREALKRFGAELRREEGRRKRAEGELIAERRLRQAEAEAAARMLEESCVAQQRHARALRDAVAQNKGVFKQITSAQAEVAEQYARELKDATARLQLQQQSLRHAYTLEIAGLPAPFDPQPQPHRAAPPPKLTSAQRRSSWFVAE